MYEILKERYQRNFVTKEQLKRYVALNKITQEQYQNIIEENEEKKPFLFLLILFEMFYCIRYC